MMEVFKGTGFQCLEQCIKNKWNGSIFLSTGEEYRFDKYSQLYSQRTMSHVSSYKWLLDICTYLPPKTKWAICTRGQALDEFMRGKTVRTRYEDEDNDSWDDLIRSKHEGWDWEDETTLYSREEE